MTLKPKPIAWLILGLAALVALPAALLGLDWLLLRKLGIGSVAVPAYEEVKLDTLRQGWPPPLSHDYHHRSQGTKILPLAWFLALEEPSIDPIFPGAKLASREYLSRFGFLYGPVKGPHDLPIGFAIDKWDKSVDYVVPPITRPTEMVGLTCAACHTGRIDFDLAENKRKGFLIEGGSAMINLGKFQEAVGQSLFWTLKYRLKSFISEVQESKEYGDHRSAEEIERDLRTYIDTGIASRGYAKEHKLYPVDAGFARTDALGLIGNRVFGPLNDENQSVTDAPVNFPHLWDTAWFDWVQYNASIRMPLARNIGEALGVGAAVKPARTLGQPYKSTVRVQNLAWMEDVLGGDEPLVPLSPDGSELPGASQPGGLRPPRWDEVREAVAKAGGLAGKDENAAMEINPDLRDRGKALYREHCLRCHLPDRETLRAARDIEDSLYWVLDRRSGKKFLNLKVIDLSEIGTDPNQAVNFYRRFAVVPNPRHREPGYPRAASSLDRYTDGYPRSGIAETISAEQGLYRVTSFLRAKYLEEQHLVDDKTGKVVKESEVRRLDRFRTLPIVPREVEVKKLPPDIWLINGEQIVEDAAIDDIIRDNLGYKARPLDGIWATPPYFHNGSVPNLDQVLRPASERDEKFYLGTTRFDPVKVGYRTEEFPGAFLMDTTIEGNKNTGHEFRDFTLEELELAILDPEIPIVPKSHPSRAERLKRVLGEKTAGEKTDEILRELRSGRRLGIPNPKFLGIPGVIGAKFDDGDRRAIVEYLKSL